MKTYITTKEHPEFKESVKLTGNESQYEFPLGHKTFYCGQHTIDLWLKKGYIKEVEKPEFTKSDVLEIVGDWLKTERNIPFDQYFDNRIENRGK